MGRFRQLLEQGSFKIVRDGEGNIIEFDCSDKKLNKIPTWFWSELHWCQVLICYDNKLTSLPELPVCQRLHCYDNELTSLPELYLCQTLLCHRNQLTSLPELPNCKFLYCYFNKLTSLPELPQCRNLRCYSNQLISLPELPLCNGLQCSDNKLVTYNFFNWKRIWKRKNLVRLCLLKLNEQVIKELPQELQDEYHIIQNYSYLS